MMANPILQPGDVVYVDYGEAPHVVHTRLVTGVVDRGTFEFMILTPDFDQYVEVLDASNPDFSAIHWAPAGGGIPPGVPAAAVYSFAPMTAAELARRIASGRNAAAQERVARGLPPLVVPGVNPPDVPDQSVWVLCSNLEGRKFGEVIVTPPHMPVLGDYGLVQLPDGVGQGQVVMVKKIDPQALASFCEQQIQGARSMEAVDGDDRAVAEDIRTMSVRYSANGERMRSIRDSIGEMVQVEMEDFPYEPRTSLEYLKGVQSVAESNYVQHLAWVQQSRIPEGSRAVFEDETLAKILDVAISYDALNVSNLASFELLCRRRQLIGEAHAYNPSQPSYQGADFWLGDKYKHGGAIVVPALTEHVSKKLQAESQILKERRKLEEAKAKGRGAPKGGPKNQPGAQGQ
eukprot:symbB.v1.2.002476.t1/scaffold99.1/size346285/32